MSPALVIIWKEIKFEIRDMLDWTDLNNRMTGKTLASEYIKRQIKVSKHKGCMEKFCKLKHKGCTLAGVKTSIMEKL